MRVSNLVAYTFGATCALYVLVFTFAGSALLASITAGFGAVFAAALKLNRTGRNEAARLIIALTASGATIFYGLALGPEVASGIQLMAFPLSILPLVLFECCERPSILTAICAAIIVYAFPFWVPSTPLLAAGTITPATLSTLCHWATPVVFALLFLIVYHLFRTHDKAERRLEIHRQSAAIAFIEFAADARVLGWNAAASELFGFSEEEALKLTFGDLLPHEKWQVPTRARPRLRTVNSRPESSEFQATTKSRDGKAFSCLVTMTPLLSSDGQCISVVATVQDISKALIERQALERSEANLRASFETPALAIAHLDAIHTENVFTKVNASLCSLLGHSHEELLTCSLDDLLHAADRDETLAVLRRLKTQRAGTYEAEQRLLRKDGHYVWVRLVMSVAKGGANFDPFVVIHLKDVTDRHVMAESLRARQAELVASHEIYKTTFDQANIGLLHMSLTGKFLMGNQAMVAILGLSSHEDLVGHSIEDFTHPDDVAHDRDMARRMASGEKGLKSSWEKRFIRGDGSVVHVRLATKVLCDARGIPQYFLAVVQDLSEARAAHDLLHMIIDALPVAIGYLDLDFKYKFTNVAYANAFGAAKKEIEAGNLQSVFDAEATKKLWAYRQAARDGKKGRVNIEMVQPVSGRKVLLDVHYLPHCESDGRVRGIIVLGEDITARVMSERQLQEQQAKLVASSKMATLGEMAGGVAHEVNNPLAIIDGKARQLRRYIEKDPPQLDKVEEVIVTIAKMTERIAKIIRGLSSFSRSAEGDPFVTTPLVTLITDSMSLCAARFKNNAVSIEAGPIDPGIEIECRATEISQVILNLLSNSFDAVSGTDNAWVSIDSTDRGDTVEIAVTDSGGGIPEAIRDKILCPFFTTKAVGKGTGLGLSISKGIIEGHRGELRLDEASPHTRFVIVVPKRQPRGAERPRLAV